MDKKSITTIIVVLVILLVYYGTEFCDFNNYLLESLVDKLGPPSVILPESAVWKGRKLHGTGFKKVGLFGDSVYIWTPINLFAHMNRSRVAATGNAYATKLRKLLSCMEPGSLSFDPLGQVLMVKAPYLGQAMVMIYLVMKMTTGELGFNFARTQSLIEKLSTSTIPSHCSYNSLVEPKLGSYIGSYVSAYC